MTTPRLQQGLASFRRWLGKPERTALAVASVVAIGLAIWLTAGVWGNRAPAGVDVMGHLARAEFAVRHLIGEGKLDGWDPTFILGYQEFLFLGPGFTWAVAIVHALSLGLLSIEGAFKVVVLGSFVAVPLSVSFLARSFGLGAWASGVAGVLSLAVNNNFGGVGLQGLFEIGLIPHQFAAPFFFLALGGALRLLQQPNKRWTIFTAAVLAALLISHGRSVVILGVFLVILLGTMLVNPGLRALLRPSQNDAANGGAEDCLTRKGLVQLMVAGVAALGLAAFSMIPLAAHWDLQGPGTAWGKVGFSERLGDIWDGQTLLRPGVATLAAAGLVYGLVRVLRGRPYALPLVVLPLAYLFVAHSSVELWPDSVFGQQLPDRGLGFAGVLAMLPLAPLLARLFGFFLGPLGGPAALAGAVAIVVLPLGPTRDLAQQMPAAVPQMTAAARELARVVPDGARFVTQRDYPVEFANTGVPHPDFWLPWASGRNTLNSFSSESSTRASPAYEPEHILDRPPEVVADSLSRLGVSHLVTITDEAADQIAGSSRFEQTWRSSPLAIFAVTSEAGQPEPGALLTADAPIGATLVRAEHEHVIIDVDASQPTEAAVAIGWSPKWHGQLDGAPVELESTEDGLLAVDIPEGGHRLVLDFQADKWDSVGRLLSLLFFGALIFWVFRGRSRPSRDIVKVPDRTINSAEPLPLHGHARAPQSH